MSNIDKHAVQAVADLKAGYTLGHADVAILNELARIALASLEAETAIHRWRRVTVEPYGPYPWHYGNFIGFSKPVEGIEDEYFYSAPAAPVSVPDDVMAAMQKVARIRLDLNDFDGDKRGILDCLGDAEEALIEVVNRRAAMLQGSEQSPATDNTAQQFEALAGSQATAKPAFTVTLPAKVYIREMRANVLRFADVVDAITAAGGKVVHADGYTSAGSGKP